MNSIRKLITTQVPLAQRALRPSSSIISQSRSVVYLHKGPRVRGLVRDEEDYMYSPSGKKYGLNQENLQSLKEFLGKEYELPDELSLQILTHKSFAHGIKPFNEKLSILGSHFLKNRASLYTIHKQESKDVDADINGLSISQLGSLTSRNITSSEILYAFIKKNNLTDVIFWKKRDALLTDPSKSGEIKVSDGVVKAIIGAILSHHGKVKAEKFIDDVLLNSSNEKSLVNLSQN
ncbi:54S ribosomal protein L15, mitochondrial [Wickerhamomyces ciferrii]|uniref:54S ribosomal protein L15, mitochondrial n=1 Tax=Wickerhamomyces ciferrii (strain ATCC 14091 / BCRC 22168 / CBS 111 / JCM 3599 / NBRC 0793 / NRRL Y-1031 F-60-10) TaxID=1206466 RepID=K0KDA9_WICCF|nr:54S ribosomal protein L15, mitochondrial [Wickerhamomyces ciferrii]CCH40886.1 54S ribosomal protein L15, mitochondrial [Wickerhamomyces ciferrii]